MLAVRGLGRHVSKRGIRTGERANLNNPAKPAKLMINHFCRLVYTENNGAAVGTLFSESWELLTV